MLYRETSRTHPGCSECTHLITVVPTQIRKGLTLQPTSSTSSHPSPSHRNQTSPAARAWGWASTAVTYHRELDFCPPLCPLFLRLGWAVNKCGKRHLVGSSSCCRHPPRKNNRLERSRSNTTIGLFWLKWSQEFSAWLHLAQAKQRATNTPVWQLFSWHPAAKATRTCWSIKNGSEIQHMVNYSWMDF